jgi:hypothetical protein
MMMMEIYARVLCYRNSNKLKKSNCQKELNKRIFDKALQDVDQWVSTYNVNTEPNEIQQVCNLYSMKRICNFKTMKIDLKFEKMMM